MADKIELTPEFKEVAEYIRSGEGHLFVTGNAGTGKSTLLQLIRDQMEPEPVVLAPTGVAAINVAGQTIHRFFGFNIETTLETIRTRRVRPRYPQVMKELTTIIIDEVSMVRADVLDWVDNFLRMHGPVRNVPFGGVRMVFFGDLFQLPPVVTSNEKEIFSTVYESPYFFSAPGIINAELKIIELTKIFRQTDRTFIDLLNKFRNNAVQDSDLKLINTKLDPEFEPPPDEFYISLSSTNARADAINDARLNSLRARKVHSEAETRGEFTKDYYPAPKSLSFKPGAQIMMLNNDADDRWVNGSIGKIQSVSKNEDGEHIVKARLNDGYSVEIEAHEWKLGRYMLVDGKIDYEIIGRFVQLPFRLAWAVTVHKSQGKTFDRVIIDIPIAFSPGQVYVALSRCTTLDGIVLARPIKKQFARIDWKVHEFLAVRTGEEIIEDLTESRATEIIANAIKDSRSIKITYLDSKGAQTERELIPEYVDDMQYGSVTFLGLRAFCKARQDDRTFRIDRILKMEIV